MSHVAQAAIAAAIQRFGADIGLVRAGVTTTVRGLVAPMDSTTTNMYFDANESVGLEKPAVILYLSGTSSTAPIANDAFSDGDIAGSDLGPRLLTVRKVQAFRLSGDIILYLCVCD